jgi:hypothetical protein
MSKRLSEFHFFCLLIDGTCFRSIAALHDELSFKLGLPSWYGRNWDALLDCLSSIGDNHNNLCSHWNWGNGKRLVLSIQNFSIETVDDETLLPLLQIVADANDRLAKSESLNRIWLEYNASPSVGRDGESRRTKR